MADEIDLEQAASTLRVTLGLLLRRLRQVPTGSDLTMPESSALAHLDRSGPTTAGALARVEQISPQSMGATLAALEGRRLIARESDPEDGRRVILSVTAAGRELLRSRRDARTARIAQALQSSFTPDEIAQLTAVVPLLERLVDSI